MKRLSALLTAVLFCVAILSPPAAALRYDPTKPLPFPDRVGLGPQGDDGAWADPHSKSNMRPDIIVLSKYGLGWSVFYYVSEVLIGSPDEQDVIQENESRDQETTTGNRGSSSSR